MRNKFGLRRESRLWYSTSTTPACRSTVILLSTCPVVLRNRVLAELRGESEREV